MGFFKKIKENVAPKDINLQIVEATAKLSKLEDEFRILVKKERNSVANAASRMAKKDAEDRLRNAYIMLRLVNVSQDRFYHAASALQLRNAVKELSACLAVINKVDKKANGKIGNMFLQHRAKKMMDAAKSSEEGGLEKSIFTDEALESALLAEGVMDQLVNTSIPLERILHEDMGTQDNLDEFNTFCSDQFSGFSENDLTDDLDELISKFG